MWWIILLILALLLQPKEPFEVKIKATMPSLDIKTNVSSAVEGIQNYTTRPLYKKVHSMIPYKHVYRKIKRLIF
jgi:hypothetical protein